MKKFITLAMLLFCKYAIASSIDTLYLSKHFDVVKDISEACHKGVKTELEDGHTQLSVYHMNGRPIRSFTYRKFSDKNKKRRVDGRCVLFYDTGEDSLVYYRSKNIAVGFDTVYYKNGKVSLVYKGNNMVKHTELWQYWPNGKLKRQQNYVGADLDGEAIYEGKCFDENGNEVEFSPYEVLAKYPLGSKFLSKVLSTNIRYPIESQRRKQTGRTFVSVSVDENGYCYEYEVVGSSGYKLLDEEAIRVVKKATESVRFTPGTIDGIPTKQSFVFPMNFTLY